MINSPREWRVVWQTENLADHQVQSLVVIQEHKPSVASRPSNFSRGTRKLDLYMKPSNFNRLAHFFFFKMPYGPTLYIYFRVTFGHFEIFQKKNLLISFLLENRKVFSIFQQHREVGLEYKVAELLLAWVLLKIIFYSPVHTIETLRL